ncbi:chaplin [Streptomyces palmae]|uniref:Chaplin n=1 Tax=Streptomyces palmae TaxID=1701085 RepID=A0A4Z0GB21_9ACTN|nr:chaplin [Streptomyces palmae]TGA92436.1 chaplin [Streptomyces palmae]
MNRIVRAAGIAAAGCVLLVGSAGAADACGKGQQTRAGTKGTKSERVDDRRHHHHHHGAEAEGVAVGSPGVLSGDVVQVPIDIPVEICGDTINIIGVLNSAVHNVCVIG